MIKAKLMLVSLAALSTLKNLTHTAPDGFCVDVHRSNSLQQELDHLQKRVAGLFGAAKLFGDVSLQNTKKNDTYQKPENIMGTRFPLGSAGHQSSLGITN